MEALKSSDAIVSQCGQYLLFIQVLLLILLVYLLWMTLLGNLKSTSNISEHATRKKHWFVLQQSTSASQHYTFSGFLVLDTYCMHRLLEL